MWASAVAGGGGQLGALLPQTTAHDIEQASERVRATAESCWEFGMEERAVRKACFDEVIKPVVKQNLRVVHHDEVHANEHLKHALVEVKVDWPHRLGIGPCPIEHRLVAFSPDGEFHLEWAIAETVIIHIVLKRLR